MPFGIGIWEMLILLLVLLLGGGLGGYGYRAGLYGGNVFGGGLGLVVVVLVVLLVMGRL